METVVLMKEFLAIVRAMVRALAHQQIETLAIQTVLLQRGIITAEQLESARGEILKHYQPLMESFEGEPPLDQLSKLLRDFEGRVQ